MSATVRDLASFRRRFVRAEREPDAEDADMFFVAVVAAEFAAAGDKIDCACCGSKDIHRGGSMQAPWKFGSLTSPKTGTIFGYALCELCVTLRKREPDDFVRRVDAAFDGNPDDTKPPAPDPMKAAFEKSGKVCSFFYELNAALLDAGWTKGKCRWALREASAAISGVNAIIAANQLDEADRRLELALRAMKAVADTARGLGFIDEEEVEVLQ